MSGYMNEVAPGSRPFYEMENERLRQELATVIEQRDRAQKAVIDADQYIGNCFRREWQKAHEKAIAEARENGDD